MRILLTEDIEKLGTVGDEVTVKDGYGRNFLIPQGKAILATPKNLKQFNHQKSIVQRKLKKLQGDAQTIADQIGSIALSVKKKVGDQGKLFGSVTSQEIGDLLKGKGIEIDRRKIQLSEPIKTLGDFKVPIKLHPEVIAEINLNVAAENPEPVAETSDPEKADSEEAKEKTETNEAKPE